MESQSSYTLTQSGLINFKEKGSKSAVTHQVPVTMTVFILYHINAKKRGQFYFNRLTRFRDMAVFPCRRLCFKMPILEQFGNRLTINGIRYCQILSKPRKAHSWPETRVLAYRSSRSVEKCNLGAVSYTHLTLPTKRIV